MTRRKTGPPPKPPSSLPAALKGMALGHGLKTLMGVHPQPLPLSDIQGPKYIPTFNKGYARINRNRTAIRNHRGIHRILYSNAINREKIRFLNLNNCNNCKRNSWYRII